VKRVLELIQQGKPVPRGTLQTVFTYTPYDELRRLGLDPPRPRPTRAALPDNTGMLVVDRGAARLAGRSARCSRATSCASVNGQYVTSSSRWSGARRFRRQAGDAQLSRGGSLSSGRCRSATCKAITPAAYLEFGDAIVHTLSYQQARHFNLPVRGAYVANPGYSLGAAGVPRGAVITAVNSKPVEQRGRFSRADRALGRWRPRRDALHHHR
jgi:hypothetical protein